MDEMKGFKQLLVAAVLEGERQKLRLTRVEYSLVALWQSHKDILERMDKLKTLVMPTAQGAHALERFLESRGVKSPMRRGG